MYALLSAYLQQDDLGVNAAHGVLDVLLELSVAY
jgi:hypothetical protein